VRELEAFQVVLLRRPVDAPALDDATLDRLQDEHLAFLDALRAEGRAVTTGPFLDQEVDAMTFLCPPGTLLPPGQPVTLDD